jgi:hypothetical protein
MHQTQDWYGLGWAVFRAEGRGIGEEYLPPLENTEAQAEWLAGFLAARIDQPETPHWGISPPRSALTELESALADFPQCLEALRQTFRREGWLEGV